MVKCLECLKQDVFLVNDQHWGPGWLDGWMDGDGRVPVVAQTPCFGPESRMDQHSKGLPQRGRVGGTWATLPAATRKLCAARRSSRDGQ